MGHTHPHFHMHAHYLLMVYYVQGINTIPLVNITVCCLRIMLYTVNVALKTTIKLHVLSSGHNNDNGGTHACKLLSSINAFIL